MKSKLMSLACILLILPGLGVGSVHAAFSAMADETRSVSGFTGLSVSGSFDVEVRMGSAESLRITGDADAIRDIETFVKDGTLHVRVKQGVRLDSRKARGLKVYVSAKKLDNVAMSGSGKTQIVGTLSGDDVSLSLSGSGRMEAMARVSEANVSVSGSGVIALSGRAEKANVRISGSGRIDGADMRSTVANVRVSGSGNASVHAEKTLATSISGSGNVRYAGNPEVSLKRTGSGRLTKL